MIRWGSPRSTCPSSFPRFWTRWPQPCRASNEPPAGVYVDATTGLGGHASLILQRFRPAIAVLFDRDPKALEIARARLEPAVCQLHFVQTSFSHLATALAQLGISEVSAILADFGVSSMQLDTAERGFSLRADGPLDMRMDTTQGETAAQLIERLDAGELTRILRDNGEEPDASRIAREIVKRRPKTTLDLAQVVMDSMSSRQLRALGKRIHPATRTFQALRIEVNRELEEIDRFLADAPGLLMVGGRLAVISFHSLEDRRVKRTFRGLSTAAQPPAQVPVPAEHAPEGCVCDPRCVSSGQNRRAPRDRCQPPRPQCPIEGPRTQR